MCGSLIDLSYESLNIRRYERYPLITRFSNSVKEGFMVGKTLISTESKYMNSPILH